MASQMPSPETGGSTLGLLHLFQAGHSSAGNALLTRYETRVRTWATGRLPANARAAGDTGDIVSTCLWKLYRNLPDFQARHDAALAIYVRKMVLNEIRSMIRRAAARPEVITDEVKEPAPGPSPLEDLVGREALEQYESALSTLSEEEQYLVHLKVELQFDYKEIAAAAGKPSVPAARMAVLRAIRHLTKEMSHAVRG